MTPAQRNKLLAAAGATSAYPTTRAAVDKRLESIGAGRGLHKPTVAHPYAQCFSGRNAYGQMRLCSHPRTIEMEFNGRSYLRPMTCEEFIRESEAAKRSESVSA